MTMKMPPWNGQGHGTLIGDERQWTILGFISLLLIGATSAIAATLPAGADKMPAAVSAAVASLDWIPNIRAYAVRSSAPEFYQAFLALGLIVTAVCTALFLVLRARTGPSTPFPSGERKVLAVGVFVAFAAMAAYTWWSPSHAGRDLGLLEGRWGAMLHLALSGRIGAATAGTGLFFLAPFWAISLLFISIARPVVKPIQLHKQFGDNK